jgi:murein DD-endopeptidase MepM/ murein hydrolase activator NlpD
LGTPVFAIRAGRVRSVGPGVPGQDSAGIHSRHVIIETTDPTAEGEEANLSLYMVYLHLDSIAAGIVPGEDINQHALIGTVGEDDATYPHLHFEFRKDKPGKQIPSEKTSVHPLAYLPHTGTGNFTKPVLDRWNTADPQSESCGWRLPRQAS